MRNRYAHEPSHREEAPRRERKEDHRRPVEREAARKASPEKREQADPEDEPQEVRFRTLISPGLAQRARDARKTDRPAPSRLDRDELVRGVCNRGGDDREDDEPPKGSDEREDRSDDRLP